MKISKVLQFYHMRTEVQHAHKEHRKQNVANLGKICVCTMSYRYTIGSYMHHSTAFLRWEVSDFFRRKVRILEVRGEFSFSGPYAVSTWGSF